MIFQHWRVLLFVLFCCRCNVARSLHKSGSLCPADYVFVMTQRKNIIRILPVRLSPLSQWSINLFSLDPIPRSFLMTVWIIFFFFFFFSVLVRSRPDAKKEGTHYIFLPFYSLYCQLKIDYFFIFGAKKSTDSFTYCKQKSVSFPMNLYISLKVEEATVFLFVQI